MLPEWRKRHKVTPSERLRRGKRPGAGDTVPSFGEIRVAFIGMAPTTACRLSFAQHRRATTLSLSDDGNGSKRGSTPSDRDAVAPVGLLFHARTALQVLRGQAVVAPPPRQVKMTLTRR